MGTLLLTILAIRFVWDKQSFVTNPSSHASSPIATPLIGTDNVDTIQIKDESGSSKMIISQEKVYGPIQAVTIPSSLSSSSSSPRTPLVAASNNNNNNNNNNNGTIKPYTIIIQLSGEMGNNIQHIAHGIGLQLWAREMGIATNLLLRHHVGPNNRAPRPKWKSARDDIRQCFPNLKDWHFAAGNTKEYDRRKSQQHAWLGGRADQLIGMINAQTPEEIERGLTFFIHEILPLDTDKPQVDSDATIQLPYLYSTTLDVFPILDRYYDPIREFLIFNESCCASLPDPDEWVFHFRNYHSELPSRRAHEMGFDEMSPTKVVKELFANLTAGSKVAITTRVTNARAQSYVEAFSAHGMTARLVTNQTGVQDFCFLLKAQRELVGHARSTFVGWAAFLGTAPSRLYHVDNFGIRTRHPNFKERFTYHWTHPDLRQRIRFELYQSEEVETNRSA